MAGLAALAGFYLTAALYLRPFWQLWRTHITPGEGDPLFVVYLLKWVGHEAGRAFGGCWDAPFFYPARGVLAYSDHMFGPGLAAAAWNAVVPGWVGAYNVLLLSCFALTGWTMSRVLRRSGRSWPAALLGGALYSFCPFRWDQLPHLQVLVMAAVPLTLWSFDRLLERPSWPRAAAFLLAYAVHLTGGCYLAAMIHLPLAVLACNRAAPLWRNRQAVAARLAVLATAATIAAGLLAATFYEYWRVGRRDGLTWSSSAGRHWGASLLSYLQPSDSNLYSAWWPRALFRSENCLFPGLLASTFCIAGLFVLRRTARRTSAAPTGSTGSTASAASARSIASLAPSAPGALPSSRWRLAPLVIALAGWTAGELLTWSDDPRFAALARWVPGRGYGLPLTLTVTGVALWAGLSRRLSGRWPWAWITTLDPWPRGVLLAGAAAALLSTPLFYLPLSRLVPGLASMRVPARFQAFTMFAIAFGAAAVFEEVARRLRTAGGPAARRRAALFTTAVLAAALLECAPRALPWLPLPEEADFPDVYSWLANRTDVHAMIELPLKDAAPEVGDLASLQAMYFGTRHWHPLVNGFSAHFPPAYERLEDDCCYPMPEGYTLDQLQRWGVTHILLHGSKLPRWQLHALASWETANAGRSTLVHEDGNDRVYELHAASPGTSGAPAAPGRR